MGEKTDTGKEVVKPSDAPQGSPKPKRKNMPDPLDVRRKELLERIELNKHGILISHEKIELVDSLQRIIKIFSGAKAVKLETYSNILEVSLPDVESLGVFFRELEHLKSEMPKAKLTYSGKVDEDKILAEVRIGGWG